MGRVGNLGGNDMSSFGICMAFLRSFEIFDSMACFFSRQASQLSPER